VERNATQSIQSIAPRRAPLPRGEREGARSQRPGWQAEAQAQEIKRLEDRLAQAQARIKELVATIQHLPQAPATVKGSAQTILSEQAANPLPAAPKFDTALLSKTQTQLQQAHASVLRLNATLNAQKR